MFLKISQISLENTCVESLFNKIGALKAWNFIKKRLQHKRLPVKVTFLIKLNLKNICERLLLIMMAPFTCLSEKISLSKVWQQSNFKSSFSMLGLKLYVKIQDVNARGKWYIISCTYIFLPTFTIDKFFPVYSWCMLAFIKSKQLTLMTQG